MYDEALAERIRPHLAGQSGVEERKMFGGIAFLLDGHMCCGIIRDSLMARVGAAQYEEALALPHARPVDITGRPMTGMVMVDPAGFESDADLAAWVDRGVRFASTLPPKTGKKSTSRRSKAGASAGTSRRRVRTTGA